MTARASNFGDLLDPRFQEIVVDETQKLRQLDDMIGTFYRMVDPKSTGQLDASTFSEVSGFGNFQPFVGQVSYGDVYQGFDKTLRHVEYTHGFQIERKLFDDAKHALMEQRPRALALAWARTRQTFAAQPFNNAFGVDLTWMTNTENVALVSNSHTTTTGASTASGYDNMGTAALSAVALQAARVAMRDFRDLAGNKVSARPSMILTGPNLEETTFELIKSSGKVDVATNNRNIHEGRYRGVDWEYIDDTNDWFLIDEDLMKGQGGLIWIDRIALEFGQTESFDEFTAKWRAYARLSLGPLGWQWIYGSQVS